MTMDSINENAFSATIKLSHIELVGLSNSVLTALTFHEEELHPLTALTPDEARTLIDELSPIIERIRDARVQAGLPRLLP